MRANRGTQRLKVSKSFSVSNRFLWFKRLFGVWSCSKKYICVRSDRRTLLVSNVLGRFFLSSEIVSYPDRSNVSFNIYPNLFVRCIFSCFFFDYPQIVFSWFVLTAAHPDFSFDRFVVTSSSVVAVSPTRSRILNIRPCHVLIPFRIFSKGWGEGCWIMWRIWVWLHWWTIRSAGERDVKECKILYNCERFEPRSHFKSRLSLILFDRPGERSPEQPRSQGLSSSPRKMRDPGNEVESWIGLLLLAAPPHKLNLLLKILYVMKYFSRSFELRRSPSGNLVILIFSGEKPYTRKILK